MCALPTAAFFRVFTPGVCLSVCVCVFEEARIYTYIKGGPEEACNQPNCKVVFVVISSRPEKR